MSAEVTAVRRLRVSTPAAPLLGVLATLGLGLLLAELNEAVFAVALPTMAGELHAAGRLTGVTAAYVAAACAGMLLWGRLGDRYARPRVFAAALGLFLVGSVVGGLSTGLSGVVTARAVQGLGGGGLLVLLQAIVADLVPARRRAPYLSAIGAVFAVAAVLGPVLGGWVTTTVGWRWIFWMNLPLGVVALLGALRLRLPAPVPTPTPTPTVRSAPVTAGHNTTLALVAGFVTAVAAFGVVGYLPTYLQLATGLSPVAAGSWMLALVAGLALSTVGCAQILRRTGRYRALPALGCVMIGLALVLLASLPADAGPYPLAAALFALGAGMGGVVEVLLVVVQNGAPAAAVGTATAAYGWSRELGVVVGTLAVGSVFTARLSGLLQARLPAGAGLDPQSLTPEQLAGLDAGLRALVASGYRDALAPVLLGLVPLVLLAAVALCFLRPVPLASGMGKSIS